MPDTGSTPPSAAEKAAAIQAEKDAEKAHQAELKAAKPDTADLEKSIDKLKTDLEEAEKRLAKAKEGEFKKHAASTLEIGGVVKQLREEGDSNTGKPEATHVVQQGGGGAVDGASGQAIR